MADLTGITSTDAVRLVGSDAAGVEQTPVASSVNGDLLTADGVRSGVYGQRSVPLANTPVEAKVGASVLANRKYLQIYCNNNGLFWGLDNTVTTTSGTPLVNQQVISFAIAPGSSFTVWVVGSANGKSIQVVELA